MAQATWAGTSGATKYRLEYKLDDGAWVAGKYDAAGWFQWAVHAGQRVAIRVQADNGSVYSPWSASVSGMSPVTHTSAPTGILDRVSRSGNTVSFQGWAFDPDSTQPIAIHAYAVAGTDSGNIIQRGAGYPFVANLSRPDVGAAYPGMGDNHGFSFSIPNLVGTYTVCLFMIDAGGDTNPILSCSTL